MKETVNVEKYTCDGCGKVILSEPGDIEMLPKTGLFGEITEVHSHIQPVSVTWYACRRACVRSAALNALDRE